LYNTDHELYSTTQEQDASTINIFLLQSQISQEFRSKENAKRYQLEMIN
jgi:hypothetical protein